MKKLALFPLLLCATGAFAATDTFPEWKGSPQAGLPEGLIAGVACVESMGDMTLDMDVATMEARASLAASLEAMVQKEVNSTRDSETKKIQTADRSDKVRTVTITAKSNTKQIANQLMRFTWVSDSVTIEKDVDEYLCTRVVAKLPSFAGE